MSLSGQFENCGASMSGQAEAQRLKLIQKRSDRRDEADALGIQQQAQRTRQGETQGFGQMSSKARFLAQLLDGQAKSLYAVIRQPGEKDHARHAGQASRRTRGEMTQLEELDSSGHAQGHADFFVRHLERQ